MRSIPRRLADSRAIFFCCAIAILFVAIRNIEAGPVRHRRATPFTVVLQPFKMARTIVHAAAAPVVDNAPRVLAATAVAPIEVAYFAPRRLKPRAPQGGAIYETDEESDVKPIRVAY